MNFLQLCQKVGSESNTIPRGSLTTVVGQTNERKAKVIQWVADAWRQVQNAHASWNWMQAEFYGDTVASTQRYAYTAFKDRSTDATITRFADWIYAEDGQDSGITLYDTTIGLSDEGPLVFREWEWFYRTQLRGTVNEGKPTLFSIAPDNKLVLSLTPDSADYRIRGRYRKDEQTLALDADTPECPTRFHDVIVDIALMLADTHDESPQFQLHQFRRSYNFCNLERDQLPRVRLGGPLA